MSDPAAPDLPDCARLGPGPGGLPLLEIRHPRHGDLDVFLHGAHVTHWSPRGHSPVLWLSPAMSFRGDAAIRGGVPICFPWFGAGPSEDLSPSHGFARTSPWRLGAVEEDEGAVTVDLLLDPRPAAAPGAPGGLYAAYRIALGSQLSLTLTVRNPPGDATWFEAALHTYLAVGDVREVAVEGLAGASYVDRLGGPEALVQGSEPLRPTGETDRIYQGTLADVVVDDPVAGRRLAVCKTGSASTVVWNPWEETAAGMPDLDGWETMLCVETANVRADRVSLEPGAEHAMTATIEVLAR